MAKACELLTILRSAYLNSELTAGLGGGGFNGVKRGIGQVRLKQDSQPKAENDSPVSCVKPRVAPN